MAISSSPISSAPISGTSGVASDTSLEGTASAIASASAVLGAVIIVRTSYTVAHPDGTVVCPLTISVSSSAAIDVALEIDVTVSGLEGAASAVATAAGSFDDVFITVPLRIDVLTSGYFSTPATRWRPVVYVGGTDLSSRLTGSVIVEANEGQARIAEFSLLPSSGSISPSLYLGRAVQIDYAVQQADGSALYPTRLFTGIIEAFDYDPVTRLTQLRCTDDLQARVTRLTSTQIDTLVAGYWSAALLPPDYDNWEYAQYRLSTRSAALDSDAYSMLRVTDWAAKTTADYEFDESLVEEASLQVEWAQRTDLRNKITLTFEHRFNRLKVRVIRLVYRYPFSLLEILQNLYTIPTTSMFEEAIQSTGWELIGEPLYEYPPKGPVVVDVGGGGTFVWVCSDQDLAATTTIGGKTVPNIGWVFGDDSVQKRLFFQALANIKRRYAQQITESYTLTVSHAGSIASFGEQTEDEKANLDVKFDSGNWESWRPPAKRSGGEATGTPQEPVPVITAPALGESYLDYMPDAETDRTAASAVMQALIARAQSRIRATHRLNSARFVVPLDPTLDLTHTVLLDTTNVTAKGKVRKVVFRMDMDSGKAVSEIDVAISSTAGDEGTDAAASAPDYPDPWTATIAEPTVNLATHVGNDGADTPAIDDTMTGYFTNVGGTISRAADGVKYPIQFTIDAPEIPTVDREHTTVTATAAYSTKIPNDTFTVSA